MAANPTGSWRNIRPEIDTRPTASSAASAGSSAPTPPSTIDDERPVVNYDYCKGCGICAEECPTKCIDMVEERQMKKVIMGNHALSYGATLARAQVIAAYPITPQTQVVELLSEMCADGKLNAKFIKVESEHSAMAACIGASSAGARTFTATSSQGLALMHEMLHWAAGGAPADRHGQHQPRHGPPAGRSGPTRTTACRQRDTGWMQFYCASNQEVLDTVILAFKVSEKVLIPAMVVLDAFSLSHTYEVVDIPDQAAGRQVPAALQAYKYKLTPDDPHAFGGLTGPEHYMEFRYKLQKDMEKAPALIEKTGREFEKALRPPLDLVEPYLVRRRRDRPRHVGDGGLHGPRRRRRSCAPRA